MVRKIFAVMLSLMMLSAVFLSCSKTTEPIEKTPQYVEDGPWWNDSIAYLDLADLPEVRSTDFIDSNEDFVIAGMYCNDGGSPYYICRYDYDGNMTGKIDPGEYGSVQDVFIADGETYAVIYTSGADNSSSSNVIMKADFGAGRLVEVRELNVPPVSGMFSGIGSFLKCEDSYVYVLSSDDEQTIVIDEGGEVTTYQPDFGEDADSCFITNTMMYGDKLVFEVSVLINDDHENYICMLDMDSLNMRKTETGRYLVNGKFVTDDGVYFNTIEDGNYMTGSKVVKYDPGTDSFTDVLRFSDSYINNEFGMSANYCPIYASGDKVIVSCESEGIAWGNGTPVLITLTKANSNPNAGKRILELGYLSWEPYKLCPAINRHNRENSADYIRLVTKYYAFANGDFETDGIYQLNTDAAYLLMEDIRAGTGPDMAVLDSGYSMLNNDEYLHRIDGSYRIGYCRRLNGLIVRTELLSDTGMPGITYAEYDELVRNANNGLNPLGSDRISVFNSLFRYSSGSFFDDDGRINLDNDDFRALAGYIRNMASPSGYTLGMEPISDLSWKGFTGFLRYTGKNYDKYSIIGYPSRDGMTPVTIDSIGIAVTECTSAYDECCQFAYSLLDPQLQSRICEGGMDPVDEDGMRLKGDIVVDELDLHDSNNMLIDSSGWPPEAVDFYITQTSYAEAVPDVDTSVIRILDEEIQPYLEGQKSIDEVIRIATNRIDNMMDER